MERAMVHVPKNSRTSAEEVALQLDEPEAITFKALMELREKHGVRKINAEGLIAVMLVMHSALSLCGVTEREIRRVAAKSLTSLRHGNFVQKIAAYYRIAPSFTRDDDLARAVALKVSERQQRIIANNLTLAHKKFCEACQVCQS